ncbi:ribonuclease HIII [candidate division KSB1 bacterium]|nr:ribonuclease HIII [candidate division KSB1 bacterium]
MVNQVISLTRKPEQASPLHDKLEPLGFEFSAVNYAFWQARGDGLTITFYKSGKLVIQGSTAQQFANDFLEDTQTTHGLESVAGLKEWIGSDESGKGDFFGPLVVAAVHVDKSTAKELTMMGVQDCKSMTDARVIELAVQVAKYYPHTVVCLDPESYNISYQKFKNVNLLLANSHARAIDELISKTNCNVVLADQFGNEKLLNDALKTQYPKLKLIQQHRAETNPAVAAASVLARAKFLHFMQELSHTFQMNFPKGATHVIDAGQQFIRMHGHNQLHRVAKLHFKTVQKLRG